MVDFGRSVILQLNDREFRSAERGFRIAGNVKRKGKRNATGTFRLWNVAPTVEIATLLSKRRDLRVRCLVGFEGNEQVVFDGNIVKGGGKLEAKGPDRILSLECREGQIRFSKPVDISVVGEAPIDELVAQAFTQAGYTPAAYLATKFEQIRAERKETLLAPSDFSTSGSFGEVIREIEGTFDVRFTVMGEFIEVTDARKPRLREGPVYANRLRNIIDAPKPKDKGVEIKVLLDPKLRPADRFLVETDDVRFDGGYTCKALRHTFDSGYADAWDTVIHGRKDT